MAQNTNTQTEIRVHNQNLLKNGNKDRDMKN